MITNPKQNPHHENTHHPLCRIAILLYTSDFWGNKSPTKSCEVTGETQEECFVKFFKQLKYCDGIYLEFLNKEDSAAFNLWLTPANSALNGGNMD